MEKKTVYKIKGFKFHQYALNALKEQVKDNEYPLHASAAATYIGLMSEVSPSGLIPADFKKAQLADKLNMSRQTFNDGYKSLLDRKFIKETLVDGVTQLEIVGYAASNFDVSSSKSLRSHSINYFEVPEELFNTPILADLVKSKEAKGIILMLDLFNHFSRELNIKKKNPANAPDELSISYLKKALGKPSASRVRGVLDMLSPLFSFTPEKRVERIPVATKCTTRKWVPQLWIRKYYIYINPTCTVEKEATTEEQIEAAKAIKDAHYRIKGLKLPLKQVDKNGIGIAYSVFVREIARFVEDAKLQKQLLRNSMQEALEDLEEYSKKQNVKSIGAFMNNSLKKYAFSFLKENRGLISRIMEEYQKTGASLPTVLVKYGETL